MSSSLRPRYRIGFVADWDAGDPGAMSGAAFYMRRAFLALGHEVVDIFPTSKDLFAQALLAPGYLAHKAYAAAHLYYSPRRHPLYVAAVSAHANRRIRRDGRIDFVFSQSSTPVGALRTKLPVFMTSDQPFGLYLDGYVPNPASRFVREGVALERAVAAKVANYIFPSEWACDAFRRTNPEHPQVAQCIPWGANLDREPEAAEVADDITRRAAEKSVRFLFVGRDWSRKRGAFVLRTFDLLRESGMDVGLDIVGAGDVDVGGRPSVTVMPYIDKTTDLGRADFADLMRRAHFLFVPSRAEAYGHVFCEAAAFGVPSLSSHVGGIPTIIENEVNGLCLPVATSEADFAAAIRRVLATATCYARMAQAARRAYEVDLSWLAFATKVLGLAADRLARSAEPAAGALTGPMR